MTSTAQYVVNEEGERVIAASLRADGSLRKERRVRAGYVPQEEVPLYVPRHVRERRAAEAAAAGGGPETASVQRLREPRSVPGLAADPPRRGGPPRRLTAAAGAALPGRRAPRSQQAPVSRALSSVDEATAALAQLGIGAAPAAPPSDGGAEAQGKAKAAVGEPTITRKGEKKIKTVDKLAKKPSAAAAAAAVSNRVQQAGNLESELKPPPGLRKSAARDT